VALVSALDRIAVKVVVDGDSPSGNGTALLHELADLLDAWVRNGQSASIDLRSLPLTPGDYAELRDALGEGSVTAHVEAIGASEVRETRYPGVWRVTHYNDAKQIVADLIEVCAVPSIIPAPPEDAADGLARLRETLAGH
jgi:hydrogenase-1 operon protein HyaF